MESTVPIPTLAPGSARRQAAFVACYFAAYVAYLFLYPEGELLHWVSLVLVPLVGIAIVGGDSSVRVLTRSIGLDFANAARGLGWVLVLGAAFQGIQLLNARQRAELLSLLAEPFGPLLPVGALLLLLATVATTEEVFFRGIMQTRLAAAFRSHPAGLLVTTVAFALYHVPYAYLSPSWPSAGDLPRALQLAAVNGALGGVVLGAVFWRSRGNLVAAILLHALIDLVPATRLVGRLLGDAGG